MKKWLFFLLFAAGCFTYQLAKNVTDAQNLYRDVSILTAGKSGGQAFIPSQYGAIYADLKVLEDDYAQKNALSLAQVRDFENTLAIFRKHDSVGASAMFWKLNCVKLDTSAYEIVRGELTKNKQ